MNLGVLVPLWQEKTCRSGLKILNCQITNLIKWSVFKAAQRKAVRLVEAARGADATGEVQVIAEGGSTLCTAPVVAVGTATGQRTIAGDEEPGSVEF